MRTTDTLKEYYVNLQSLYNNAVNILTAINQSLQTTSSEVTVNITNSDDTVSRLRIPSFLYLENKLESLESNLNSLIHMPESGEAWFNTASSMHKLELVKSSNAPLVPSIKRNANNYVQFTNNTILKDMVLPKMFLRMDIQNLPDNITELYVKKITINSYELFNAINNTLPENISYTYIKNYLSELREGVDYVEYDTTIKAPTKRNRYFSQFRIVDIPALESGNPWIDYSSGEHTHNRYLVSFDTIVYYANETSNITYNLKVGDRICLRNENVIYKIIDISTSINNTGLYQNVITIEEELGHVALQTYEENSAMEFEIYDYDYSEFHYVDVPLEEDPYLVIFIGTIYNGVRSGFSLGQVIDLNNTYVKDNDGNVINKNGRPMNYISYYSEYCNNIGDLIEGLSRTAYPQLSNFSSSIMYTLTNSINMKNVVNNTIDVDEGLQVQRINSHIVDDDMTINLRKLHQEKSNINTQIDNVQSNIDNVYNQLTSIDFSTEKNVSQFDLKNKLTEYYNERTLLTSQKINIVNNIDIYKSSAKNLKDSKYRVRGITDTEYLSEYVKNIANDRKVDVIGIEIEYKYRSISSDTNKVSTINSSVFTDWIRQPTIEKERYIEFDNTGNMNIKFSDYNSILNIIKWNQIDIPISQNEDVVIRVRYKLNIGQPFINIYTPWSDEITKTFPPEFEENTDITTIMKTNDTDVISATFNKTLINDGYTEHISDKIIDNSKVYYHGADNIFSGFLTSTNTLMSIKDKFNIIDIELNQYKNEIERLIGAKYKVYVVFNGKTTELTDNGEAPVITVNETSQNEYYKRIEFNISIYNEGNNNSELRLYPVFEGANNNSSLYSFYNNYQDTTWGSSAKYFVDKLIYKTDKINDIEHTGKIQYMGQIMAFTRYNVDNGMLLNDDDNQINLFSNKDHVTIVNGDKEFSKNWNNGMLTLTETEKTNIFNNKNLLLYENIYYNVKNTDKQLYLTSSTNLSKIIQDNGYELATFADIIRETKDFIGATVTTKNGIPSIFDSKNIQYITVQPNRSQNIEMVYEYFLPAQLVNVDDADLPNEISVTTSFAIKTNPLGKPSVYTFVIKASRTPTVIQ